MNFDGIELYTNSTPNQEAQTEHHACRQAPRRFTAQTGSVDVTEAQLPVRPERLPVELLPHRGGQHADFFGRDEVDRPSTRTISQQYKGRSCPHVATGVLGLSRQKLKSVDSERSGPAHYMYKTSISAI
jgi:hypothetical protein